MPEKETSLFEKFKLTGKHGIIYGVGSVLQQAISFLLLPLYTTRFEASDYGILGLITVTGSVLTIFFTLGINYGLLRSYYDYKSEKDRRMVISTALFIVIISSLVLLVLGVSLAERFSLMLFETGAYKIHFIIMFITAALNILNIIPIVVFRMKLKSRLYITLNVTFFAIGIGVII